MQLQLATFLISLLIGSLILHEPLPTAWPNSAFDQYGAISWEDETARLDNFAIHLLNDKSSALGFILVFDQTGGCPGEAKARAIRAKRYLVEHRGVPWNKVIWRREGYGKDITTFLIIAPKRAYVPYPFYDSTTPAVDGPATRACRAKLEKINRRRW